MRIAIVSDIHDRRDNFENLLTLIKNNAVDHLFLLGDFWAPSTIIKGLLSLALPTHIVRWNNDGEIQKTTMLCMQADNVFLSSKTYENIQLDGKNIVLAHYPDMVALVWDHVDAVFYWHIHQREKRIQGKTLIVNPWAVLGDRESASFAIWDTQSNDVEFVDVL